MKNKKILILYVEVMPYNIPVFINLVNSGCELYIIQLDNKKLTPYEPPTSVNIRYKNISDFNNYKEFINYCNDVRPNLVFVSEIINIWYFKVARFFRKNYPDLSIIVGSDAQWTGTRNNWIKRISFPITYKKCFTHILVAGLWQVEYARKLGFKRHQILFHLYSANIELYQKVNIQQKSINYPKKFLYIGRFHPNKGLTHLVEAWNKINDKKGWTLTLVGNGPLEIYLKEQEDIEVLDFLSQEKITELMSNVGCAVVPSIFEPWGLVIHEAVAGGLPIIVTQNCGATHHFVINSFNGYIVPEKNSKALSLSMEKIINASVEDLIKMAKRSRELSSRITPEIISHTFLDLI